MNIIKYALFTFVILSFTPSYAQSTDPVLMRINGTPVAKSDFEYAYKKNLSNDAKKQTVDEFLESYINFKLNVEEAKRQGMDREASFVSEYRKYMDDIEKPYLTDTVSPLVVARGIYDRLKENIEVSQILLQLPQGSIMPKDTAEVYRRILPLRELAAKGDDKIFEELVLKYSEDSVTKMSETPGYLGWKTALMTPYAMEQAMYNGEINSVSEPVRTKAGYHILKIHNKRADLGQLNLAHILLRYPQQYPTQHEKDSVVRVAQQVSDELRAGGSFQELCTKYSGDPETASQGGILGWFGIYNPLPPVFEHLLFGIQAGGVTQPVEIDYGFHIFKIIDKTSLPAWENLKDNILKAIPENERNEIQTREMINRLVGEYPYTVEKSYSELQQFATSYSITDSLFFHAISPIENKKLLSVAKKKEYTILDFIHYLEKKSYTEYTLSTDILSYKLNDFILACLIDVQRDDLPNKYPDFRHLANEFYDGILYFDIMNKEVWGKAQADKAALQKQFEQNPSNYKWDAPKYKGYVIHTRNKAALQKAQSLIAENKNSEKLKQILESSMNTDSVEVVIVDKGLWGRGENVYVDRMVHSEIKDGEVIGFPECMVEGKLISTPENLDDALGQVTADYQKIVESQWITQLRERYKVEIIKDILNQLK